MKRIFTLFLVSLVFNSTIYSQTQQKEVLIISCIKGTLLIDGVTVATIDADDATKQQLAFGEHYIQVKNDSEKFSATILVDDNSKGIIRIGCKTEANPSTRRIIDKEVSLSGALGTSLENNVFALDFEDEILINCDILNKKGNATLFIKDYETGREIYRKDRFELIKDEKIRIPAKGIYYFTLFTEALFGKTAKITIDRIPSSLSKPDFKTSVDIKTDTVSTEILNTTTRVFSTTNLDHPNKTTVRVNLPANTTYWTYWIGVGEEAKEKMDAFTTTLMSGAAKLLSANPLVLFGMKIIPALPSLNTPSTISYKFMSTRDAQQFMADQQYSYYTFKYADNITTDYALINGNLSDLVLSMKNSSIKDGYNVEIRVVAFSVTSKYVMMD